MSIEKKLDINKISKEDIKEEDIMVKNIMVEAIKVMDQKRKYINYIKYERPHKEGISKYELDEICDLEKKIEKTLSSEIIEKKENKEKLENLLSDVNNLYREFLDILC